jgi:FeS assembly ATPase SufC
MPADERARLGLFLAFQYPTTIPGVTLADFLRRSISAVRYAQRGAPSEPQSNGQSKAHLMPMREFRRELLQKMKDLGVDQSFARRYVNDGFSGGEKKRVEILHMAMAEPKFAVLDETDSGLDIDALRIVAEGVSTLTGPNLGVLLITHYQRLLDYIVPDFVHVLVDGRIVRQLFHRRQGNVADADSFRGGSDRAHVHKTPLRPICSGKNQDFIKKCMASDSHMSLRRTWVRQASTAQQKRTPKWRPSGLATVKSRPARAGDNAAAV